MSDMTDEEVDAELDRLGIDMQPAIEKVRKALWSVSIAPDAPLVAPRTPWIPPALLGADLVEDAMPFVEWAAKHADNPTLRAEAEVWLSRYSRYSAQ